MKKFFRRILRILVVVTTLILIIFMIRSCDLIRKGTKVSLVEIQDSSFISEDYSIYLFFNQEDGAIERKTSKEYFKASFDFTLEDGNIKLISHDEENPWTLNVTVIDPNIIYISRYNKFVYRFEIIDI